jgi:hypothetical protein
VCILILKLENLQRLEEVVDFCGRGELFWENKVLERKRDNAFGLKPTIAYYFNVVNWVDVLKQGHSELKVVLFKAQISPFYSETFSIKKLFAITIRYENPKRFRIAMYRLFPLKVNVHC